ncbi:MAG: RNA methyltransferase [Cyanobacteriota bacterium]
MAPLTLPPLVLVLVEPAGPLNVGSVARLCANFGIRELRLVAPRCDPLGDEARRMAVHGGALLAAAVIGPTLAEALADCRRVIATSGRSDPEPCAVVSPDVGLSWLLAADPEAPAALVFGREDRGLSNDELLQAGRIIRIGTGSDYPSLNLSHAVAVVLHALHQRRLTIQTDSPGASTPPLKTPAPPTLLDPAPRGALEATLSDAEALLLDVGFLYPHTAHARMAKVRGLLQRAQINPEEVALLRGMVRQLRWASRQARP